MKQKKNTYLLILLVLIIWGIIGYKIYSTMYSIEDIQLTSNNSLKFTPKLSQNVDSFVLNLNYRDPFFKTKVSKKKKSNNNSKIKIPNIEIPFPSIVYNGLIVPKEKSRKTIYLVSINNNQHFLSVGTEKDGVVLVKGSNKSITVKFQQHKKEFPIQK